MYKIFSHTEFSGKGINLKGFRCDLSLIKVLCVHTTNLCFSSINLSLVFCTMHGPHKKLKTYSIAIVNPLLMYHNRKNATVEQLFHERIFKSVQ